MLYVAGAHGRSMTCPICQRLLAEERPLFTMLNRRLALQKTCEALAELVREDDALVGDIIAACQLEAEAEQRPDPSRLVQLRQEVEKLKRAIEFTNKNPGETEADQEESAKTVRALRNERTGLLAEIGQLEAALQNPIRVPTEEAVRALLHELHQVLVDAADGGTDEEIGVVREIIEILTGGRIELVQMGERRSHGGWLQGQVQVRLLSVLVQKAGGRPPAADYESVALPINYRWPVQFAEQAEVAWTLYNKYWLEVDIAEELDCSKPNVTKLLKYAAQQHGKTLPDGRTRRGTLEKKHRVAPLYVRIADQVGELADKGKLIGEIAAEVSCDRNTATKALAHSYAKNGDTAPDGRTRRKRLAYKGKPRGSAPVRGESDGAA